MPKEDKDKINIKNLCINIGVIISISGIIFILGGFIKPFRENYFAICMIIWLIGAGFDVYYISKSHRYIKK